MHKEVKELVREAQAAGCETHLANGHVKINTPNGPAVLPSTPSDHRSTRNSRALLARKGVVLGRKLDRGGAERMAKASGRASGVALKVLQAIQDAPRPLSNAEIRLLTGLRSQQVSSAISYLRARNPDLRREGTGWCFSQPDQQSKLVVGGIPVCAGSTDDVELPQGSPSLFEAVAQGPNGGLVLKGDQGNLWIAFKIDLPSPEMGAG